MSSEKPDLTNTEATRTGQYAGKDEVILRDHVFDGIQEYDQNMPNWWLFTLYSSIIFFFLYWFIGYTMKMRTPDEIIIDGQVSSLQVKKEEALKATLDSLSDQILIEQWASDTAITDRGEATYMQICHTCHAPDLSATLNGSPLPGRPLNDGHWEYGRAPLAIFKIINEGTPPGAPGLNGMPMAPKGGLDLSAQQVAELTAYLIKANPNDFKEISFDADGKLIGD